MEEIDRNCIDFWSLPSTTRRPELKRFKSMKELINSKMFKDLSITDMRMEDWQQLDLDICPIGTHKDTLAPQYMPVLNFILNEIERDALNFYLVPPYIRESKEFKRMAVERNPDLKQYKSFSKR